MLFSESAKFSFYHSSLFKLPDNSQKPVNFRASPLVFGIKLGWGFGENTSDTLKTEIQYSNLSNSRKDEYVCNEFVVKIPAGKGISSIGIKIPYAGGGHDGEWTEFILRGRVFFIS